MESECRPRVQLDLAQRRVFIEHVNSAKLVQIKPHARVKRRPQHLWPQIDLLRPDQRPDPRPLMALLDLVPPAIDLIAHHRRLLDEKRAFGQQSQQRLIRPGHCTEELPARKNAHPSRSRQICGHLLVFPFHPLPAQPPMHCGQQALRHWRLGQRQQLRLVEARLRPLRLRVEFANRLNLITEELNADRPVRFRRVHIQNPAPTRELPRHLHQVHLRIAHRGQVPGEHLDVHLFASPQRHREAGIVVAVKELERRRLYRRNQDGDRTGGQLPQCRCPLLLHVGMWG